MFRPNLIARAKLLQIFAPSRLVPSSTQSYPMSIEAVVKSNPVEHPSTPSFLPSVMSQIPNVGIGLL
ncbi:reverse transcrpitase, partial [Danaus plexippus plexippus]